MPSPAKYLQPVHFEDFDGLQFERLVFAYHARTEKWISLEWYGQTGSDLGAGHLGCSGARSGQGRDRMRPMRQSRPVDFTLKPKRTLPRCSRQAAAFRSDSGS